MKILCPISVGDLVDRVSILIVKKDKFRDHQKREDCEKELLSLAPLITGELSKELEKLVAINRKVYEARELQYELMKKNTLKDGNEFGRMENHFSLTSEIYLLNEKRYKMKSDINNKYKSDIVEQKSF